MKQANQCYSINTLFPQKQTRKLNDLPNDLHLKHAEQLALDLTCGKVQKQFSFLKITFVLNNPDHFIPKFSKQKSNMCLIFIPLD